MKDLAIIGAGPGGVTAAIYAKRSGLEFDIFEKYCVGGNVVSAFEIENYPGVGKIVGADLAMNFMNELSELKIDVIYDEVVEIKKTNDGFELKTAMGSVSNYKKVLLALGTKPRQLNVQDEEKFLGRGISFCATCDGAFYKDKEVLVVGGGNSALTETLYLSNIVKKAYVITRHELKGDKKEIAKIKATQNVEVIEFKSINKLLGEDGIKGVQLIDTETKELSELNIDGIFVYIGQLPPTGFLKELEILNERGFIEVDNHFETTVKGLFAIGDCINKTVRQIVTATGDAASAIHYINE